MQGKFLCPAKNPGSEDRGTAIAYPGIQGLELEIVVTTSLVPSNDKGAVGEILLLWGRSAG